MAEFPIGQKVTVCDHYLGPVRTSTVAAVSARMMKLADGSRWHADGRREWGRNSSWYTGRSVRCHEPSDDEAIERKRLIALILKRRDLDKYSTETLRALAKLHAYADESGDAP